MQLLHAKHYKLDKLNLCSYSNRLILVKPVDILHGKLQNIYDELKMVSARSKVKDKYSSISVHWPYFLLQSQL